MRKVILRMNEYNKYLIIKKTLLFERKFLIYKKPK